tara:strand:- start:284 stop:451 length:168 start_codon:yes stop_codon:yes gene_type:complete
MSTYKGIQGITVQSLASDLAASAATEGQMWYNSSTGAFKIVVDDGGYTVKTITTS